VKGQAGDEGQTRVATDRESAGRRYAHRILERLWTHPAGRDAPAVVALLDAARDERIWPLIRRSRLDYRCLFLGEVPPVLAAAAPYLVDLAPRSPFTRQILELGWGNSWGLFVRSHEILQDLRRHFRRLLPVRDESGHPMFFRFYDPRVLRTYLPTCTLAELRLIFGPVEAFLLEGEEDDELLELSLRPKGPVRRVTRL
jgi:hypothetical protein